MNIVRVALVAIAISSTCLGLGQNRPARVEVNKDRTVITLLEVDGEAIPAIQAICDAVGQRVTIRPLKGRATASLRNVRFETALMYVLKQVDATYDVYGEAIVVRPTTEEELYLPHTRVPELSLNDTSDKVFAQLEHVFSVKFDVRPDVIGRVRYSGKQVTLYNVLKKITPRLDAAWDRKYGDDSIHVFSVRVIGPTVLHLDPKEGDFESGVRRLARKLDMKIRIDNSTAYFMDHLGVVRFVVVRGN